MSQRVTDPVRVVVVAALLSIPGTLGLAQPPRLGLFGVMNQDLALCVPATAALLVSGAIVGNAAARRFLDLKWVAFLTPLIVASACGLARWWMSITTGMPQGVIF